MSCTRREFIKDTTIAGAVVTAGTFIYIVETKAAQECITNKDHQCPYFDQPLMCEGPDELGKYKCDK